MSYLWAWPHKYNGGGRESKYFRNFHITYDLSSNSILSSSVKNMNGLQNKHRIRHNDYLVTRVQLSHTSKFLDHMDDCNN